MFLFLLPAAEQFHRKSNKSHCGGRIPAGRPVAAAYAEYFLQKPKDSRNPGQG